MGDPNVSRRTGQLSMMSRGTRPMFLLITSLLLTFASLPSLGQNNPPSEYKIRQSTDLVVLHLTVTDRKGDLVPGLPQQTFQVYEDSVQQPIETFNQEDIPATVGILVDNSNSMDSKRPDVNAAALAFARSSNPQDQMFVVNFSDAVGFSLPAGMPFTNQPAELEKALAHGVPQGRTALYDALYYAMQHLKRGDRDKKALIVISDGGDNQSTHSLQSIKEMAMNSNAIIYAVGLVDPDEPDHNPKVLRQLAQLTGGEAFFPSSSKDVLPICEKIALDIRRQYTISYVPLNKTADGAFRKIEIRVMKGNHGHLNVRTRTGYFAPSAAAAPAADENSDPNHSK